jgi:hypothetical protein
MLESQTYRQYARDCIRIAASMSGKGRQTLLKIADAWEARAAEAESKEHKSDGGKDPTAVRTQMRPALPPTWALKGLRTISV